MWVSVCYFARCLRGQRRRRWPRGAELFWYIWRAEAEALSERGREGGTASRVVAIRGSLVQLLSRQFYACMPSKHTHTHTHYSCRGLKWRLKRTKKKIAGCQQSKTEPTKIKWQNSKTKIGFNMKLSGTTTTTTTAVPAMCGQQQVSFLFRLDANKTTTKATKTI